MRWRHRVTDSRLYWLLAGWIGLTAGIALLRRVDLLWAIVVLLVFATVAAAALPHLQLRGVRVRRLQFPRTAVVGEAQQIGYEIQVPWGPPRYGLEVYERLNDSEQAALAAFIPRSRGRQELFFMWTPTLRGRWRLKGLQLESRYPLGLLRAQCALPADEHEVVIYPDFVQLPWLPVEGDAHGSTERKLVTQRGGHAEFFALKPYSPGDEARRVHWRASARLGEMVTREYERAEGKQLWVVLELAASVHVGNGSDSTCEQMVLIAHSAIVKAHAEGIPVGLLYRVADAIQCIPASADRATYQQLRDTLANVHAHAQLPIRGWLERFHEQLPLGGSWLLFNLEGQSQRAALLSAARQRGAIPLVVEFDVSSFARRQQSTAQPATLKSAAGMVSIVPYAADLTALFRS